MRLIKRAHENITRIVFGVQLLQIMFKKVTVLPYPSVLSHLQCPSAHQSAHQPINQPSSPSISPSDSHFSLPFGCIPCGYSEGLSCAVNPADVWEAFGAIRKDRAIGNDQTVRPTDRTADSDCSGMRRNGGMSQFASVLEPAGLLIEYEDDFEHSGLEYQVHRSLVTG